MDSDDYLESNALEVMAGVLARERVEVLVMSNMRECDAQGRALPSFYDSMPSPISGRTTPLEIFSSLKANGFLASAQTYALQAAYLYGASLCFIPHIIYEDVPFCTQAIVGAQSVYIDRTHIYNYRLSPSSIMRAKRDRAAYERQARSYHVILLYFWQLERESGQEEVRAFCERRLIWHAKELMRTLEFVGYASNLGFSKQDLEPFLPYLKGKYRFCYHFPRIYGFPKRCRLALKALFTR